jgi:PDZ domain-containing protein
MDIIETAKEEEAEAPRPEKDSFPLGKWIFFLVIPLAFMLILMPTGFVVESPGPAFDLQKDVTVDGAQVYPSQGQFLLTSVTIQESSLIYHLLSTFDNDYTNIKETDYLGKNLDVSGNALVDQVITVISQDTASVDALQQTDKQVTVNPIGSFTEDVAPGFPAFGVLNLGDVIVQADGKPVTGVQALRDVIASKSPGDTIRLQVRTINRDALSQQQNSNPQRIDLSAILDSQLIERDVQVAADPSTGRPVIGASLRDYFTYSSPVQVDWNIQNVEGPSAGLMMTLSLINTLTPQDLTRGKNVAGTGEILLSGQVGPIGGLPMKIKAAESKGAQVFIYPADNQPDLAGVSTSMALYPVSSLPEALNVLGGL